MKQQINTRLSARTLSQIEYLAKHWETSNTAVIARAVDEAYREQLVVNLYEDNAGRLFVGTDSGPWWNVTGAPDNSFRDDVAGIMGGSTDNWTVKQLTDEPDGEIVAYMEAGSTLHVETRAYEPVAGIAARRYIGLVLLPTLGAPIHW